MYIKRHLEATIEKLSGCCKVLLVTRTTAGGEDYSAAQAGG